MRLQRRWRKASVLPFCPVAGCTRAEALLTSLSNTCPSHSRDKRRDEEEARRSRYRHFSEPGRHLPNQPREHFDHATVLFDWFANSRGEKLRTFITPPNHTTGKVPVIFFVGWLSCDSMEYPDRGTHDGFGILLRRRIDGSGYATVRMDKPAAGKSQGECAKADSEIEITGWPAAFNGKAKYDFTDLDRVFVVGLCNRSGFSAMHPASPWRAASSPVAPGAYMVRAQVGTGAPPAEVNTAVKAFADFYDWYHDEWDDSRAGCRAASGVDEPLVRTPLRGATVVRLSFISSYRG